MAKRNTQREKINKPVIVGIPLVAIKGKPTWGVSRKIKGFVALILALHTKT